MTCSVVTFEMHFIVPTRDRASFAERAVEIPGYVCLEHGRFLAYGHEFDTAVHFRVRLDEVKDTVERGKWLGGWVQCKFPPGCEWLLSWVVGEENGEERRVREDTPDPRRH